MYTEIVIVAIVTMMLMGCVLSVFAFALRGL